MNKTIIGVLATVIVLGGAVFAGYQLRGNNDNSSSSSGSSPDSSTTGSGATSQPSTASKGKTADYSGKGLTTFPKAVLSDKSITVLDLSNNNLTGALPAEIHDLANLETLDVSDNQMTGIPAEVGQLKHLKVLNYANNKITGLPNELGNLTQLEIMDLSGNNVSQQDLAQIRAKLTNTQFKL